MCGSRLARCDRVRAYMCTAHGAWCPVSNEGTRPIWTFVASAWKKFQPVRARRAFKKVVFLSIDCP
jgi:hypothetical protein